MSKISILKLISFVIVFGLFSCQKDDESTLEELPEIPDSPETAMYRATFHATWSVSSHPADFPNNDHFSPLIGMVHNANESLYQVGTLASVGVKNMAETGSKGALTGEINALIENARVFGLISGGGIGSGTGSVSVEFEANQTNSLVSIVSMIAPSPDWFVGVAGVELFENNEWIATKTVEVGVYDAGTDSGSTFTSSNSPTNPPENIHEITTEPLASNGTVASMGTIVLERLP